MPPAGALPQQTYQSLQGVKKGTAAGGWGRGEGGKQWVRAKKEVEEWGKPSAMCIRFTLDDGRVNLIEDPSAPRTKVVVMRMSMGALFNHAVTPGEGGDSTEDIIHLSLLRLESHVGRGDTLSQVQTQMLEPFAAEAHITLLWGRGCLLSCMVHMEAEDMDARVSYRDILLLQ
ncbi:unnamed protein product, partial [Discosporangium mesarthrocarpum]